MFVNNPYAQAGWHNPQNPNSINGTPWNVAARTPPTFGALPSPDSRPPSFLTFEFSLNPTIFNSIVTGPKKNKYFEISTAAGTTTISKPGSQFAMIVWSQHPTVEASGVLARQRATDFLRLSADHSHRSMIIAGRNYAWVPRESGIYLYSSGPNLPTEYARLTLKADAAKVVLEITSEAFQAGLFEPCIISAVLLFCERSID
ncbi:hypothetical protein CPB83DRAFT_878153 [Crepidotus variabilis]|uniref:Uncharacterized protein n=1 Tax=Crepidotus variabilis TaxID=179855 RepID=A0A9P6E5S9_9AGAR|nr:hypothetical protein CPB83DRAFT_878153 [Crepidotus variabilis]